MPNTYIDPLNPSGSWNVWASELLTVVVDYRFVMLFLDWIWIEFVIIIIILCVLSVWFPIMIVIVCIIFFNKLSINRV